MQYYGKPILHLRHPKPLPEFLDRNSGLSVEGNVPSWSHDPRVLGYKYKFCRATNVPGIAYLLTNRPMSVHHTFLPGFWPGTEAQHGFLSFLNRGFFKLRDTQQTDLDHQEALHVQAILHSFAWTLSQACYLGNYKSPVLSLDV